MHLDLLDFYAIFSQRLGDSLFVGLLLFFIHAVAHLDVLQEVERGKFVMDVFARGVMRITQHAFFNGLDLSRRIGRGGTSGGGYLLLTRLPLLARLLGFGLMAFFGIFMLLVMCAMTTHIAQQFGQVAAALVGFPPHLVALEIAPRGHALARLLNECLDGVVAKHHPEHHHNNVHRNHAVHTHQPQNIQTRLPAGRMSDSCHRCRHPPPSTP